MCCLVHTCESINSVHGCNQVLLWILHWVMLASLHSLFQHNCSEDIRTASMHCCWIVTAVKCEYIQCCSFICVQPAYRATLGVEDWLTDFLSIYMYPASEENLLVACRKKPYSAERRTILHASASQQVWLHVPSSGNDSVFIMFKQPVNDIPIRGWKHCGHNIVITCHYNQKGGFVEFTTPHYASTKAPPW